MERTELGILGTGRLGKALAARLVPSFSLAVSDRDARKGKQFAKQIGVTFLYEEALLDSVDVLLVCIPPEAVGAFFRGVTSRSSHPAYLNTATSVDTRVLLEEPECRHLRIIGAKPIGQFAAIQRGIPLTFVTASEAPEDLALLRHVLGALGSIEVGDEGKVGPLNRLVTSAALRFCHGMEAEMERFVGGETWMASALKSVAVGTILDWPPDAENAYTARLLEEIRAAEVGRAALVEWRPL